MVQLAVYGSYDIIGVFHYTNISNISTNFHCEYQMHFKNINHNRIHFNQVYIGEDSTFCPLSQKYIVEANVTFYKLYDVKAWIMKGIWYQNISSHSMSIFKEKLKKTLKSYFLNNFNELHVRESSILSFYWLFALFTSYQANPTRKAMKTC